MYPLLAWLHIVAALLWIGGMFFIALVLVPTLKQGVEPSLMHRLVLATGRRFRLVSWHCIALLLLTGPLLVVYRGYPLGAWLDGSLFSGGFGHGLATKLVLVVTALALAAWHDFRIGPAASAQLIEDPHSDRAQQLRRQAALLGRLLGLLALLIVAAAVLLVRGLPS